MKAASTARRVVRACFDIHTSGAGATRLNNHRFNDGNDAANTSTCAPASAIVTGAEVGGLREERVWWGKDGTDTTRHLEIAETKPRGRYSPTPTSGRTLRPGEVPADCISRVPEIVGSDVTDVTELSQ